MKDEIIKALVKNTKTIDMIGGRSDKKRADR